MGIMHLLLAPHFGAGQTVCADMVEFRLKKARELGADAEIDVSNDSLREAAISLTGGRGADIVIIGPNSISAIDAGLQCTAPGGTAVLFTPAGPGEHLTIDPNYLYFRDINIVTSYSCGPDDTKKSLELIREGAVTAQKLVTHRFSIDETERAYRLVADAKESLKVLIKFE